MATIQGDAVFLLKDFVRYCENDKISRLWRDLAEGFRTARRSIVAATIELPKELVADAAEFQLGLPSAEELLPGVKRVLAEVNLDQDVPVALDIAALGQVARNLIGLQEEEALRIFRKCLLNREKPMRRCWMMCYDKYVDESEKRVKKALDLAQKLAPWCCGLMRLRRRLRRPGRAEMRTRGYEEQRNQDPSQRFPLRSQG